MPRQKKPLSVKEKNGEITIKFNAEGWNPADSEFLEFIAEFLHERDQYVNVGGFLAEGIKQHSLEYFPPSERVKEARALIERLIERRNNNPNLEP